MTYMTWGTWEMGPWGTGHRAGCRRQQRGGVSVCWRGGMHGAGKRATAAAQSQPQAPAGQPRDLPLGHE